MDKKKFSRYNMEWFSKANIYIYCCIVSILSLTSYLAAFSIEISWILEARGDLPTPSYLLCAGYFVLFIASTILIHGLATQLPCGLLSWSCIIALMSIPELYLVVYMITQHWGLQSIHGLTELVGYLLRLVINCLALLCVIPTALNWRSEKRIQKQLESLANRLQLTTPLPDAQISAPMPSHVLNEKNSGSIRSTSSRKSRTGSILNHTGFSNLGFESHGETLPTQDATLTSSSENEFNASIFGLNPSMYIGPPEDVVPPLSKKTQSLLDLRYLLSPKSRAIHTKDDQEIFKLNNDPNHNTISPTSTINSKKLGNKSKLSKIFNSTNTEEPYYHTIDSLSKDSPAKNLSRNCISLDNLNSSINNFFRNDFNLYGNNLLQNHTVQWPGHYRHFAYVPPPPPQYFYYYSPYTHTHVHQHPAGGFFNPYVNSNSRQSVGTSSTDDFRKYRDVAL